MRVVIVPKTHSVTGHREYNPNFYTKEERLQQGLLIIIIFVLIAVLVYFMNKEEI